MSKEFWILVVILLVIVLLPTLTAFLDWLRYGNLNPEEKRKQLERECRDSIKRQQEEQKYDY